MKLYLKGDRCYTEKCSYSRRGYPPGEHGTGRVKVSEFGLQLREKQKVRRIYGVLERQFRRHFDEADRRKGITGENLLQNLELRLDNVAHRAGFADSLKQARQLVAHNHVLVNGRKADVPSRILKAGDEVKIRPKSGGFPFIQEALSKRDQRGRPGWLEVDAKELKVIVQALPVREEIAIPIEEQQIVELYSR